MSVQERLQIIAEAEDRASGKIAEMGGKIERSMDRVKKISFKDLTVGLSGVATGAISVYNAYDRVNNANIQVERSNLMVKRATETLSDAQKKHTEALKDSEGFIKAVADAQTNLDKVQSDGLSTAEDRAKAQKKLNDALDALATNKETIAGAVKDIELAEDSLKVKTDQAKQASENQKMAIITGAPQAVMAIVTIIDKVNALKTAYETASAAGAAGGFLSPIIGAVSSGAGIIAGTVLGGAAGGIGTEIAQGAPQTRSVLETIIGQRKTVAIAVPQGFKITSTLGGLPSNVISISFRNDAEMQAEVRAASEKLLAQGMPTGDVDNWARMVYERLMALYSSGASTIPLPANLWKAQGGIFTKPTVIGVGEAGPEAVVPLNRASLGASTVNVYHSPYINIGKVSSDIDLQELVNASNDGTMEALRRAGLIK